jgi:hypothetical protein
VPHAPTGARPVLDHDVLAELRPEEGRERAGRIVGHPAWGMPALSETELHGQFDASAALARTGARRPTSARLPVLLCRQ